LLIHRVTPNAIKRSVREKPRETAGIIRGIAIGSLVESSEAAADKNYAVGVDINGENPLVRTETGEK
jgi:hypothetical protein